MIQIWYDLARRSFNHRDEILRELPSIIDWMEKSSMSVIAKKCAIEPCKLIKVIETDYIHIIDVIKSGADPITGLNEGTSHIEIRFRFEIEVPSKDAE